MREEIAICVCCDKTAILIFDGLTALCLEHAEDLQKIVSHMGMKGKFEVMV